MEFKTLILNKNRGWRGLAKLLCLDSKGKIVANMIFSFSQPVWEDMLKGCIVLQTEHDYFVLRFNNLATLPKPTQQRSVLIKNFEADIVSVNRYPRDKWQTSITPDDLMPIIHSIKNNNNHTTSDWNYVGIRVTPSI